MLRPEIEEIWNPTENKLNLLVHLLENSLNRVNKLYTYNAFYKLSSFSKILIMFTFRITLLPPPKAISSLTSYINSKLQVYLFKFTSKGH